MLCSCLLLTKCGRDCFHYYSWREWIVPFCLFNELTNSNAELKVHIVSLASAPQFSFTWVGMNVARIYEYIINSLWCLLTCAVIRAVNFVIWDSCWIPYTPINRHSPNHLSTSTHVHIPFRVLIWKLQQFAVRITGVFDLSTVQLLAFSIHDDCSFIQGPNPESS